RMLEHIGNYLLQRQEVSEALEHYRQAIDIGQRVLSFARLASIHHGMAIGCMRIGETRRALDAHEKAVSLARGHPDVEGSGSAALARIENDFGYTLLQIGRWERAEELFLAALDHFEAAGIEAARTHVLLSMGELKFQQRQLTESEDWTVKALDLAER